jgi:hypothetical protein
MVNHTKVTDEVAQVVSLITAAIEAIASRADVQQANPEGRSVPLLFPQGIADIHVSFAVAGGVSVDVKLAGGPATQDSFREVDSHPRASAHPMTVERLDTDTNDIYIAISHKPDSGYLFPGKQVKPGGGPQKIAPLTP